MFVPQIEGNSQQFHNCCFQSLCCQTINDLCSIFGTWRLHGQCSFCFNASMPPKNFFKNILPHSALRCFYLKTHL